MKPRPQSTSSSPFRPRPEVRTPFTFENPRSPPRFGRCGNQPTELPAIPGSNAGLILAQFRADPEEESITKLVSAGIQVISVDVNGEQGYWIAGGPHVLVFNDGDFAEPTRSNGNVLIWTDGEITYRLETALNLAEALDLARNLEPFGT